MTALFRAMRTVATFLKPEDAHLARARLEGSGIGAFIRDEHTISLDWLYAHAIGGVKLEVADEDYASAREVLELPPTEEGLLQCPHCGSPQVRLRQLSVLAALSIAIGFVLPFGTARADCLACRRSFDARPQLKAARSG